MWCFQSLPSDAVFFNLHDTNDFIASIPNLIQSGKCDFLVSERVLQGRRVLNIFMISSNRV